MHHPHCCRFQVDANSNPSGKLKPPDSQHPHICFPSYFPHPPNAMPRNPYFTSLMLKKKKKIVLTSPRQKKAQFHGTTKLVPAGNYSVSPPQNHP
jgi:hypothetical protein